jgi:glycosyltransferase involved in cell wall biosynthesis
MTRDPEVCDKFVFLHDVSDDELVWLFDHATFSVLPSFHEGWGIPIAESLSRGLPCACSNTSSMVEIAEGIVEHFSPASAEECLAVMQKLLDPKELEVARKRTKQYKPFTWDASFKQVMTYLEEK